IFNVPNSVGSPLKSSLNSLDCALLNVGGKIPMVYLRLIFSIFLPLLYFTLFISGITAFFYVNKYRSKNKQQEQEKANQNKKNNQQKEDIKNKENQQNEQKEDTHSKQEENQSNKKQEQGQVWIKNLNQIEQIPINDGQEQNFQKYKLKGDSEQNEQLNLDNKMQSQRKSILNLEYKKEEEKFPWFILTTSAIFLVIYVQPDMVSQTIALLSCRKIAESSYILAFVAEECYTSQHILFILTLMLPLLIIWVFLLPFIFYKLLQKKQKANLLDKIDAQLKYGFLYKEYTSKAYYWEFVKMAEKLAIILIMNFYSQQIPTKGVIIFIIITFYGITSFLVKPYQEVDVNQIDVNSTNTCAITVLLGVLMYQNPYQYLVILGLLVILFVNLQFIIKIILKILESYVKKLEPVIDKMTEKLPFLKRCFKKKAPKKFETKTKERLRSIFQKYLDMDDQQRKKLFVIVFEQNINDRYRRSLKSKQNTKNNIASSQLSYSGKSSHSKIQIGQNDDMAIPTEKDQYDIQIKHQETKNLSSVYNLLRYPTESTPVNYNPSPLQNHNFNVQDEEHIVKPRKQLNHKIQFKNNSQVEENPPKTIFTNLIIQSPNQCELQRFDRASQLKIFQEEKQEASNNDNQLNQDQNKKDDLINFTEESNNSLNY
ncbi:hypothetical protein ABPG72_021850, partial [Tetrahymena utriculariae]